MSESNKKLTNFSQLFNRLENIKRKLFLTWDGLAEKMECDRSLFFQVKRGNCGFSLKNLAKLQELERSAGIVIPSVFEQTLLEKGLMRPRSEEEQRVFDKAIMKQVAIIETACAELKSMVSGTFVEEKYPIKSSDLE